MSDHEHDEVKAIAGLILLIAAAIFGVIYYYV